MFLSYTWTSLGVSQAVLLTGNNLTSGPYAWQLPQCSISSNPYGGATGTYGLLGCIAITYGAISAVVLFYEPPLGQGVLLGFQTVQYPNSPSSGWTPWLYIGTNLVLYAGDWTGSLWQVSTSSAISPGWHMAVIEEWYSGGTYYLALYLDGVLIGQSSTTSLPQLFGNGGPYPYHNIGTAYSKGSWPNTTQTWFWFNGNIAYVALYNTTLVASAVQSIYMGNRVTIGLMAEYVANNYDPRTGIWYDSSGKGYNITTAVVAGKYAPKESILWTLGTVGGVLTIY